MSIYDSQFNEVKCHSLQIPSGTGLEYIPFHINVSLIFIDFNWNNLLPMTGQLVIIPSSNRSPLSSMISWFQIETKYCLTWIDSLKSINKIIHRNFIKHFFTVSFFFQQQHWFDLILIVWLFPFRFHYFIISFNIITYFFIILINSDSLYIEN